MKVNSSVSNNSYKNPYTSQKERKDCNFKGYTFVKTLEMTAIDSSDSKYFKNGIPILAKYIPPVYFGILKYLNEASRFICTDAVGCCTKLTMHDSVTKTGFLAHVNSISSLLNTHSVEGVKKALCDTNPENLFVRHLRGITGPERSMLDATFEFMRKLKIPERNLIEEDLLIGSKGSSGFLLDVKTGQTYNILYFPKIDSQKFKMHEKTLNKDEYNSFFENEKRIYKLGQSNKNYLSNIDE